MDDLIAFLRARLDDDEQTARAAKPGPWHVEEDTPSSTRWVANEERTLEVGLGYVGNRTESDAEHIARHDPTRVLRATEGLRGLLQRYEEPESSPDLPDSINRLTVNVERQVLAVAFQYLALPYSDHPDYRDEWRP
ncbi:DUF6221 family protein [Streptomyces wedmorensis]